MQRRVELHDAVGVRQAAVAHARVLGIELDDVDAGDEGVEDVLAFGHHRERRLDAGLRAAVLVRWPLAEDDDDRLAGCLTRGAGPGGLRVRRRRDAGRAAPVMMNSRRIVVRLIPEV